VLLGEDSDPAVRARVAYQPADSPAAGARVQIVPSGFFGENYLRPASLPAPPLPQIEGVPLLFGRPDVERRGERLIVHADIVASAFFLATRCESVVRREVRDAHGRFPGQESLPFRAGFIGRPVVDEYAALLRKWLREAGVPVAEPKRNFSVLLTHDIDFVRKYDRPWRSAAASTLKRRSVRAAASIVRIACGLARDPYDVFDEVLRLDATLGEGGVSARSVFFVMAREVDETGRTYDVRSRAARSTIRWLVDAGATIGLHSSYSAGTDPALIAGEKAALEKVCGFRINRNRHHYLRWREVEDGWAMARAGIDWDSTLCYPDAAGFSLGVCRPIPLFDPVTLKPFGIEEHPLLVMDCTLSRVEFMGLSQDEAFEYCRGLIAQTRKHNGEFVALWHNTILVMEAEYHLPLYQRILNELCS